MTARTTTFPALTVALCLSPAVAMSQPTYMDSGVIYLKNYVTADAATCQQTATGEFFRCDLKNAFNSALQACADNRGRYGLDSRVGCVIVVPEGRHRLTGTVELCRSHVVVGQAGAREASATWIEATTTGFAMLGHGECTRRNVQHIGTPTADRGTGGKPTIKGLQLTGPTGRQDVVPPMIFGVLMNTGGKLEDVTVTNFVQGIRIVGQSGVDSNANLFSLINVTAESNEHAGIFVDGSDANAGTGTTINVANNCQRGDHWKTNTALTNPSGVNEQTTNTCAGLWDSSDLGNTWISVHSEEEQDLLTQNAPSTYFPGIIFDPWSQLQTGMCLGCYIEGPVPSKMNPYSMVLGMSSNHWDGTGFWMLGPITNKLAIVNRRDPDNSNKIEIGTEDGTFMKFVRLGTSGEDLPSPFRIRFNRPNGAVQMDIQAPTDVSEPSRSLSFLDGTGFAPNPTMRGLPVGSLYVKDWLRADRVQIINKMHAASGQYTVLQLGGENEDKPSFLRMWYSNEPWGGTPASSPLTLEYNPDTQNYQLQVSERSAMTWKGSGPQVGFLTLQAPLLENFCAVAATCGP